MTEQEEKKVLRKGRVPVAPIIPLITAYLDENFVKGDPARALVNLANMADITYDALFDVYGRRRGQSLDFNDADRLLCVMGYETAWYHELADYYQRVDLSRRKCARSGCQRLIPDGEKFCTQDCATSTTSKNSRVHAKCSRGHVRTPENTHFTRSGGRRCKDCYQAEYDAGYRGRQQRRGKRSPRVKVDSYDRPVAA